MTVPVVVNPPAVGNPDETPQVFLGDPAAARILGIPVADATGQHTSDCSGCGGGEPEACAIVVRRGQVASDR